MRQEILRFLRTEITRTHNQSTGAVLLDKALALPVPGSLCLLGESGAGTTAVGLEVLARFLEHEDSAGLYLDICDSLRPHRLWGIDTHRLLVSQPTSVEDLLYVVNEFDGRSRGLRSLVIVDNSALLPDVRGKFELTHQVFRTIQRATAACSLLVLQNGTRRSEVWGATALIKETSGRYFDEEKTGHLATIKGDLGSSNIYIEYGSGRYSRGYELASGMADKGHSEYYEHGTVKARGFWNFVEAYDRFISAGV